MCQAMWVLACNVKILFRKKHHGGAEKSKFTQLLNGWAGAEPRNVWHLCHLTKHMRRCSNAHSSPSAESSRCGWAPNLCGSLRESWPWDEGKRKKKAHGGQVWVMWMLHFTANNPFLLGLWRQRNQEDPGWGWGKTNVCSLHPSLWKPEPSV